MRLTFALLIAFVLGTTSSRADADDIYLAKIVPPCKLYKLASGTEICGYDNIEDWKKVLVVDLELSHLRAKVALQTAQVADLAEMKQLYLLEVDALAKSQQTLTKANEKLTDQLIALDKKYQDERVKPRLGSAIPWTIAAVSTAVLLGFVLHETLR